MLIQVNKDEISSDGQVIIRGSSEINKLVFQFDKSWMYLVKFAQFIQTNHAQTVMLLDDRCDVPPELKEGPVYIAVIGVNMEEENRIMTNYLVCEVSGEAPVYPEKPVPPYPYPIPHPFPHPPCPPPKPDEEEEKKSPIPSGFDLYRELTNKIMQACAKGSQILIDTSLSQPEMAAEAKAVGTELELIRQKVKVLRDEMDGVVAPEGNYFQKTHVGTEYAGYLLTVDDEGNISTALPKGIILLSQSGSKKYYMSVTDEGAFQIAEIIE